MKSIDDFIWTENGQVKAHCADCNTVLTLTAGKQCNIEVGDNNDVVGIMCDPCAQKLAKAKGKNNEVD